MPEDLTYGDLPPNVEAYLSRPGVNREKALQWFSLGISEPQTYNQAKLLAEAVGNSPEQAKVVAGQWQFESGGGVHMGANHNYFGIQAHTQAVRDRLIARGINVGVGALTDTPEVRDGKKVNTKNKFMAFDNAFDGFQAHRVFLETNPIYEGALAAKTAKDFAKGLEKAGYATATNYGTTLYNNYVLPKEKSPLSGDTRPKSFGPTTSKVKLGTSEAGQTPEIVPALPTKPLELIETNTLGVRPEISTSPAQADYIPTNSAPVVIPASEAMQMSAPKGWFGSGKSTFNAMGGSLNNSGFHALPKEVQNKIRTNMNNKRFEAGGPMGQLTEFNSGGSHEESPLGGIPQGQAPDGGTNLVEQGETKLNAADYIFSKTLKIDKETAQEFNLKPNFVNKDFAEASKIANRKDSRRENDTIETNAIQRDLDNLMNAQEAFKQKAVEKKLAEIQALDPNALEQIAQSYQPQGMPPQGMEQGMPQGQPSPEEMAMMQQQGQGQPPMDPAMMQQMMSQPQGAPQMPMQYGGPMSYKCGGGMYEYGGDLSRQFYGGGTMPGSNFNDSGNYYGLNNQGLTTNGLNTQQAAGNNGLSGGQYAQMGLSAVNAGANINRINKSDMSQDAKTSAYGDTASQIGDSTVQTIFPALAPAFAAKNAYQGMLTSNVNPETGEKAYKKGFQASSNEAVTPIHTRQFAGITAFAKDKSPENFGKMAWNFMDPGSAQLFDSAKGIWGKDKYAENQTAIDLNQASQAEAYNQQQLGLQQQQQNAINTAVQAGLAGYNQQPQDDINSNFAKYGGHQFSTAYPNFKNSAGPMGQPLTNLYAMGGMFEGPGDPVKTTTASTASTIPTGMILNPKYADQKKEYDYYSNLLKGAKNMENYKTITDFSSPIYAGYKDNFQGLKLKELRESEGDTHQAHPIYYEPNQYIPAPESVVNTPQVGGFTSANQGVAMPERGNTMNGNAMVANYQYPQYLAEAANSPEAIAHRDAVNAERAASIQRIANAGPAIQETTPQRLARERAEYMAKNQGGNNFAMGGNMNHYFYPGGGIKRRGLPRDTFGNIIPYKPSLQIPTMINPWTQQNNGLQSSLGLSYDYYNNKSLDTPIEGFKTGQDTVKSNYENREGLGAFAANMAPIAYNAYQGFLAKQMPLPENMAAQYDPYLQNVNPQLRAAQEEAAHAYAALRNMGNPRAVAANLGNLSHQNALARAEILAANENINNLAKTEAAKYNNKSKVDANLMKWQLQAQMLNAKAEAQKEAFTGIKDYSNMQTQNALASDYNAMAGEGNYTYENIPYLQGLQRTFAASQAARNKKKEDNKTV